MESVIKEAKLDGVAMTTSSSVDQPPVKRQRTSEDFFTFCQFILEYENYKVVKQEETRRQHSSSPLGSTADSFLSDSNSNSSTQQDAKTSTDNDSEVDEEEAEVSSDDSWDLITCYCMKPFAGRPMIECSSCLTWVHLSCAKVRRTKIPKNFFCQLCKEAKVNMRRSERRATAQ